MKINTTELYNVLRTYHAESLYEDVMTLESVVHEMAHILNCTGDLENWDPDLYVERLIPQRFHTRLARNIDEVRASAVTAYVLESAGLLTHSIEHGHILTSMESSLNFQPLKPGSPERRARAAKMHKLYHRMRNSRRTQRLSKRILSLLQELRVLT